MNIETILWAVIPILISSIFLISSIIKTIKRKKSKDYILTSVSSVLFISGWILLSGYPTFIAHILILTGILLILVQLFVLKK